MSQVEKFFPLPGLYGVMQIDPVATVEHLADVEAIEAAKAMKSKRYIGYIYDPIELPWPRQPWYGYQAMPIGTTLRPEQPEKAITSEMCVPIAPNTAHPTGRPPLATEPPFLFSNCYRCVESETRVCIRGGDEYDESRAIGLPALLRVELLDMLDEDLDRAYDIIEECEKAPVTSSAERHHAVENASQRAESDSKSDGPLEPECGNCHASSCTSWSRRSPSIDLHHWAMAEPLDLFGFKQDKESLLFPLIDFCFDLTDHVTQEDIGSPTEFWKERDELVAYVDSCCACDEWLI